MVLIQAPTTFGTLLGLPCWDSLRTRPDPGLRESWMTASTLTSLPSFSGILLPFLLFFDMCLNCSTVISTRMQSACCQIYSAFAECFAFILHFFCMLGAIVKYRFVKRQKRFATQCRRVGLRRVKPHRRIKPSTWNFVHILSFCLTSSMWHHGSCQAKL